ncbi:hypothetical protein [Natronogracilivirga saccharolytica]|uniref:Uncharacterized protein n=1 Tax=Natronogracilivirga saccharolytica TaxID=2812953 RepID=A0A8J7S6F1_9BACT|nr:hypothetical protein [Natronogracilivirga saccharolytica]MBP3192808.1 hypothetical protein [Natronogracilivirga saccharolytica]
MSETDVHLGLRLDANKLYYAVSRQDNPGFIDHIGQIDFSFDIPASILKRDSDTFPTLADVINKLVRQHKVTNTNLLMPPSSECWTIVPKAVQEEEDERYDHLNILTQGIGVQETEPEWFPLSNRDFKLLAIRQKEHLTSFALMLREEVDGQLHSDFEIGLKWLGLDGHRGSFMCVSAYQGVLSVSSYLLGKLRAATYIRYDNLDDLPFLWLQYASHLSWIQGIHEKVLVFGNRSDKVSDVLGSYWDESSEIIVMDSLNKMNVTSDETTFSFPLEEAFPAIVLAAS